MDLLEFRAWEVHVPKDKGRSGIIPRVARRAESDGQISLFLSSENSLQVRYFDLVGWDYRAPILGLQIDAGGLINFLLNLGLDSRHLLIHLAFNTRQLPVDIGGLFLHQLIQFRFQLGPLLADQV